MEILEYKNDANNCGNAIVPGFVNPSDCGFFHNPANYTFIGTRLAAWVKVPDSIVKLSRSELKTRNQASGIMMKMVDDEPVQMTEQEINDAVDEWCNARNID